MGGVRTRTLHDLDDEILRGRRVLVRADFNVPLAPDGSVADPARIDATLPTLARLRDGGARIVLVSHLGRPGGKPDADLSLAPVARVLADRVGDEIPVLDEAPGSTELGSRIDALADGRAVLLENIRFHVGETTNDPELGRALGDLGDVFVADAFGTAHRAHASNVGAAREVRRRGGPAVAGFLMERELRFLREALREPDRPFVAVLGGAKISGKIDLIEAILPRTDRILVGGAMANTFLRALGLETGASLVEPDRVGMAEELLERAGDRLLLPVDCVVAASIEEGADVRAVDRTEVGSDDRIGDIGPRTRDVFEREIRGARTVVWNGPMGVFEISAFGRGTAAVAGAMAGAADGGAIVVVGGGDSAAAAEAAGIVDRVAHVSTGGGASLDLLAGRELPGVEVLDSVEES